jgi:hypothetical protein
LFGYIRDHLQSPLIDKIVPKLPISVKMTFLKWLLMFYAQLCKAAGCG